MKKRYLILLAFPLVAGCLSSAPRAPEHWCIEYRPVKGAKAAAEAPSDRPKWADGAVRIEAVMVRPPYSGERIAVLRPDGTIAFDAYNAFASSPAALMRGAAYDAVEASGRFSGVVPSVSSARTEYTIEIGVADLLLDCREPGTCLARVTLAIALLRGRETISNARGAGSVEAGKDFSAAFSKAFTQAMEEALAHL